MTATWKETPLLNPEKLKGLKKRGVPGHIAIIPDGNRRWAKRHCILPEEGHRIGAEVLLNCIKASSELGVKTLTFYIFSTENWLRPQREINAQLSLLERSLIEQKPRMIENGVRFDTIGELSKFPPHILKLLKETKDETAHCNQINVVFALNYGGRDEIARAFKKMLASGVKQEDVNEDLIGDYLDTKVWGDPDLLIRTSGESRVSNFLLWQISYAEIILTETLWPEFTPEHLVDAVIEYQNRERRLGGS